MRMKVSIQGEDARKIVRSSAADDMLDHVPNAIIPKGGVCNPRLAAMLPSFRSGLCFWAPRSRYKVS